MELSHLIGKKRSQKKKNQTDNDSEDNNKTRVKTESERWDIIINSICDEYQYFLKHTCNITDINDLSQYNQKFIEYLEDMNIYRLRYKMNYSLHL